MRAAMGKGAMRAGLAAVLAVFLWCFAAAPHPAAAQPTVPGFCCLPSGECQGERTIFQCDEVNGTFDSSAINCPEPNPCPVLILPAPPLSAAGTGVLVAALFGAGLWRARQPSSRRSSRRA